MTYLSAPAKHVLVTGGAGYIGSHTCKALANAGYIPVAFDNLASGNQWAVKWGPFEKGDVRDRSRVDEVLRQYHPAAIIHFAGCTSAGESVSQPAKYYSNNIDGTLNVLDAMQAYRKIPIIFSSTCAIYGIPIQTPIPESHPQQPINPYGFSKYIIERLLDNSSSPYEFPYMALRYFNASGADPDGEIGESHDPETHLIPLAIEAALGKRSCLEIYGTDYPTSDGTAVRDYIHVTDLAEVHVKALRYILDGNISQVLNVGTGRGYSVREVIHAVEKIIGIPLGIKETTRRAGDPPVLVADPQKCKNLLEWMPRHSDLHHIIKSAWTWHSKPLHLLENVCQEN
jgi:UDP-arabinose 4-epimerase